MALQTLRILRLPSSLYRKNGEIYFSAFSNFKQSLNLCLVIILAIG